MARTPFITADGRFALGFRRDGAQEIDARVTLTNWPMADLRHAFGLDDWRVDGTIGETTLALKGQYRDMFGTGSVRARPGHGLGREIRDGDRRHRAGRLRHCAFIVSSSSKAGSASARRRSRGVGRHVQLRRGQPRRSRAADRVARRVPDPAGAGLRRSSLRGGRPRRRSRIRRTNSTAGRRTSSWRTRASATSMAGTERVESRPARSFHGSSPTRRCSTSTAEARSR